MAKKATQKKTTNKEPKKPKFNSYWIYIGIIVIFLGVQFFGGSGFSEPNKTSLAQFESFLISKG
jgi:cell division protease FtsH